MEQKIPATVAVLTRNSGTTLKRALQSVERFGEILVCDSGSTDETLAIAARFGARIVPQDPAFLDEEGRIKDYAGVRNQTLKAAQYDWFFFLDSDEYCDQELVEAVRKSVAKGEPQAYFVNRLHTMGGEVAVCDISYPNRQVRFFHKTSVREFVKPIHERITLEEGVVAKQITGNLMIPWDHEPGALKRKWRRYIALEVARSPHTTFSTLMHTWRTSGKTCVLYAWRLMRNAALCRGARVPLRLELLWFWYHAALIWAVTTRWIRS